MPKQRIIDFNDFSGGDYGILSPQRAPKGTFKGKNMVMYDSGAIGPRNGLKEITIDTDGLDNSAILASPIMSVGFLGRRTQSEQWVYTATGALYSVELDGTAHDITGDAAPSFAGGVFEPIMSETYDGQEYLSFHGEGLYQIDPATHAGTVLSNTPGTRCITRYGDRMLAGGGAAPIGPDGNASPANRVWFSEPADPDNWPVLNYFDVIGAVVGFYPQRTHLVIVTTDGWFILTGIPGINASLRKQTNSEFPSWPTMGAVVEPSGNVAFIQGSLEQRDDEEQGELAVHSLGLFTGSSIEYASHLPFGSGQNYYTYPPTFQTVSLRGPEDWFVQGGVDTAPNQAVHFRNGAWHRYEWEVEGETLLGWCTSMMRTDRQLFWVSADGVSTSSRLFLWRSYNNRPAFVSDVTKQPGDASTTPIDCELTLPEWHEEDGRNVGLVDIVVDFRSWDTGTAATNHFDLTPTVLRTFGDPPQVGGTLSFDEAPSESSDSFDGTRRRVRFQGVARNLDGTGFVLKFTNIRGVAIERVQVLVDVDGPRVGD